MKQEIAMNSVRNPFLRAAAALICAVVLLVVSAAALTHGHADSAQHVCTLCQFEHSPADIDQSGPLLAPPAPVHAAVSPDASAPDAPVLRTESDRGPPVLA